MVELDELLLLLLDELELLELDDELLLEELDELLLDELELLELEPEPTVTVASVELVPGVYDVPPAFADWPGQQMNGTLIAPLILGFKTNGAAVFSAAVIADAVVDAVETCASVKVMSPPLAVHVVSLNGIGTVSEPLSTVPVRVGSAVPLGGFEIAEYTTTLPPAASAVT